MEKLSSILPSNARIKSVDLSEAKPRRPGMPSYGVPVGTTVHDRVTLTGAEKDQALQETLTYKNPKEMRSAKIAEDITRNFFETRLQPKAEAVTEEIEEQASTLAPSQEKLPDESYLKETIK